MVHTGETVLEKEHLMLLDYREGEKMVFYFFWHPAEVKEYL